VQPKLKKKNSIVLRCHDYRSQEYTCKNELRNFLSHVRSQEQAQEQDWCTCTALDLYSADTQFESRPGHDLR
jgi:hypothetical protein